MPNDERTATAAQLRAAYVRGARERRYIETAGSSDDPPVYGLEQSRGLETIPASERAAILYPDPPPPTRPRVVRDPLLAVEHRCVGGRIESRWLDGGDEWFSDARWILTPERVALWADLYARPTEPADAGDAAGVAP